MVKEWGAYAVIGLVLIKLYQIGSAPEAVAANVQISLGRKSFVTESMSVSSNFYDTGDVWCFQMNCQHWGTDYSGPEGTPVYTPFDLTVIALGEYPPGPTMGQYIQGTFPDGYVFYSGHLEGRPEFSVGQTISAGTLIGYTNSYDHTHIQLSPPGWTDVCASSGICVDFEQYYAEH